MHASEKGRVAGEMTSVGQAVECAAKIAVLTG